MFGKEPAPNYLRNYHKKNGLGKLWLCVDESRVHISSVHAGRFEKEFYRKAGHNPSPGRKSAGKNAPGFESQRDGTDG